MSPEKFSIIIGVSGVAISALVSFIIASFRIGIYKNKVDNNCTEITELKKEQRDIRDKVIACETTLKEREPLTKRRSPVDLTDRGHKFLEDSGGKKFIDDNYPELKGKVDEKTPQTSYDIQEVSRFVIENLKDDTRINNIKEYLFKEGLKIEDVVDALGIYLRNKILKEKDIDVGDIDKYAEKQVSQPPL